MDDGSLAKIYGVAHKYSALNVSATYPNTVNSTGLYSFTDYTSWTAAFFPGLLWLWYYISSTTYDARVPATELLELARKWTAPLANDVHKNSHDIGFLIRDSWGYDMRLTGSRGAKDVFAQGAEGLYSRFSPVVGCTRSWDTQDIWPNPNETFLVIIDNMMNLELLFEASKVTGNPKYADAAVSHARMTMTNQVRPDGSQWHVVVYDTNTGAVLEKATWQGYADNSTWTRGQAWGIYGFAAAYRWTEEDAFAETALKMADLFLRRLPADGVPPWDFDAPTPEIKDTSAATITASGMLYLTSAYPSCGRKYAEAAEKLLHDTLKLARSPPAKYSASGPLEVYDVGYESILMHATPNYGDKPLEKVFDVGVVYADYYLVEAMIRLKELEAGKSKL